MLITDEMKPVFAGNKLCMAFWSPHGNLIVRFLKAPSAPLLSFLLDTLETICSLNSSTVINRPAISMLKVLNFPTRSANGSTIDLEQVALDILDAPGLNKAKFWHTPWFVSFKGAPISRKATLFFSFADSPQYATSHSIVGNEISIGGDEIGIALGGETAYTMSRTIEQIPRHYRQRPQPHKRFGA